MVDDKVKRAAAGLKRLSLIRHSHKLNQWEKCSRNNHSIIWLNETGGHTLWNCLHNVFFILSNTIIVISHSKYSNYSRSYHPIYGWNVPRICQTLYINCCTSLLYMYIDLQKLILLSLFINQSLEIVNKIFCKKGR